MIAFYLVHARSAIGCRASVLAIFESLFHKVVQRHFLGVAKSLMIVLSQILFYSH